MKETLTEKTPSLTFTVKVICGSLFAVVAFVALWLLGENILLHLLGSECHEPNGMEEFVEELRTVALVIGAVLASYGICEIFCFLFGGKETGKESYDEKPLTNLQIKLTKLGLAILFVSAIVTFTIAFINHFYC